jgi:hypothetical protein
MIVAMKAFNFGETIYARLGGGAKIGITEMYLIITAAVKQTQGGQMWCAYGDEAETFVPDSSSTGIIDEMH